MMQMLGSDPAAAVETFFTTAVSLRENDGVILALSGGADSMTLLDTLNALRRTHPFSLLAAHVNHGLRGAEADRDEAFVRNQCALRNVQLEVLHAHVAEEALPEESVEAAGRRIRYGFFRRLQQQYGYAYIVTAHTADDNLETVLLHLTRGSALHGLCGIPPQNGCILRPLLTCSRADIEAYCAAHAVDFVTDSTNADTQFSRNRVRLQAVPALRMVNPQITAAVTRLTARLREDDALLCELTEALLQKSRCEANVYAVETLMAAPPALLHRALKCVADAAGGDCEERHILQIEKILHTGGSVQIPGKVTVTVAAARLTARKALQKSVSFDKMPLEVGQTYEIAGKTYTALCVSRDFFEEKQKIYKNVLKFSLDYDKIITNLFIRQRLPGDAFHPVGGVGKTLKKYFNENAVPAEKRQEIPIVCDEAGIVLVTGFSCDNRVKLDENTKRVLLFYQTDMY